METARDYPVVVTVAPQPEPRNRLTTALRPILAIPHAILAGPVYWSSRTGGVGLLGAAAYVMAIVSWFTLLVSGEQFRGIRDFSIDPIVHALCSCGSVRVPVRVRRLRLKPDTTSRASSPSADRTPNATRGIERECEASGENAEA